MAQNRTNTSSGAVAALAAALSPRLLHLTPSAFPFDSLDAIVTRKAASTDAALWLGSSARESRDARGLPVTLAARWGIEWGLTFAAQLRSLRDSPAVVFLAAAPDEYATLLHTLRTGPVTLLHATSPQETASLTAVAYRYAFTSSSPVVLFFSESSTTPPAPVWTPEDISIITKYAQSDGEKGESLDTAFDSLPDFLRTRSHAIVGPSYPTSFVILLAPSPEALNVISKALPPHTAVLNLTQIRPIPIPEKLIPASVERILILEPSNTTQAGSTRWGPLFLDVVSAVGRLGRDARCIAGKLGQFGSHISVDDVRAQIVSALTPDSLPNPVVGGQESSSPALENQPQQNSLRVPKHETAYSSLLEQIFGDSLLIANAPKAVAPSTTGSAPLIPRTNPEYALGSTLARISQREELVKAVRSYIASADASKDVSDNLAGWAENPDDSKTVVKAQAAVQSLQESNGTNSAANTIVRLKDLFPKVSSWIIGSESWSYDLGASGLHHALACGADINLLLIDSTPYSPQLLANDPDRRVTKDAGLYAMNYGEAYVASVAVYADYSQTARALTEAAQFKGPSIVVAYLPGGDKDDAKALEVLKETKRGVDSGYWPLYRWNPQLEKVGKESFLLDSEKIKDSLREFLDRQNHLTLVSQREPIYAPSIASGKRLQGERSLKERAKDAFEKLAGTISGPPMLILFASDGGNAEKCAKKLNARAKARGLGSRITCMDEFPTDDLILEENVVFVTSTAGQGEFPQNGRRFWKYLNSLPTSSSSMTDPNGGSELIFSNVKFTVFTMGDSHYWPRPEDSHYYNKSGKDLFSKFKSLGGQVLCDIGLGNDQDSDGAQTGYKEWEPRLWKNLGVDNVEVEEGGGGEVEPITNEHMKIASNFLRGTIKEGLEDKSTGAIADSDGQLTKFHGIYQQDDRDIREDRKDAGLEPAFSFMVRCRLPAGICRPDQWLAIDRCATDQGNNTFKLTTRQTFQFHGVVKGKLKLLIQNVNKAMMDTIAACGDVNRTIMCSPNPDVSEVHSTVYKLAQGLSDHLLPQTTAYAEIWLDKKQVAGFKDEEPLYGPTYLPRKFKIAIAVPPHNDVDVHAHDLGYIAIVEGKEVVGYNVCVGGGMGVTHSMKTTYPRLSDVLGFVTPEQAIDFAEKVLTTQRDFGNRKNRKNARVKYTVDAMGIEKFKEEVERRLGWKLKPVRSYKFDSNIDTFGWTKGDDGREHFTMFIENGRVEDTSDKPFKSGLREIAQVHKGVFRLTPNQHLILANVASEDKAEISELLKRFKLDTLDFSGLRLSSSACVAFPTCGLAMAESERYLPLLIDQVEEIMEENGLRRDELVMRMTGCPNGCARPWLAEVAFVGKAPGSYLMLLGGDRKGTRLNKPFREAVGEKEILQLMRPMIKAYALERQDGEGFGDFVVRKQYIKATTHGTNFWDDMCPENTVEGVV